MKNSILKRMLLVAAFVLAANLAAASGPALIANKNVAGEKLDAATLKSVLLGRKVAWDGAGRVTLAVLKSGAVAEDFLKTHAEMSVSAFNNHWRRLAMTGGGSAPKTFDSEIELRRFVAETPGAIGFIDGANVDESVAVLTPAG